MLRLSLDMRKQKNINNFSECLRTIHLRFFKTPELSKYLSAASFNGLKKTFLVSFKFYMYFLELSDNSRKTWKWYYQLFIHTPKLVTDKNTPTEQTEFSTWYHIRYPREYYIPPYPNQVNDNKFSMPKRIIFPHLRRQYRANQKYSARKRMWRGGRR